MKTPLNMVLVQVAGWLLLSRAMLPRPPIAPGLTLLPVIAALAAGCGDDQARADSSQSAGQITTVGSLSISASASSTQPDTGTTGTASGGATEGAEDSTTTPTSTMGGLDTGMMIPPGCGNGALDPGEACDDGAGNGNEQACKIDCTVNVCGDGSRGPQEACDAGAENGPEGGCSADCTINPSSCGLQSYEAEVVIRPVDVILIIDNSGSMTAEIKGVQDNINKNFAQIIEQSGLDYRVILLSQHGKYDPDEHVCIEAPLSGIPQGGCVKPPAKPVFNPGKFYHYSYFVGSTSGWCKAHDSFDGGLKDEFGLGVGGWKQWLREDSIKHFVMMSDDGVVCGPYDDANKIAEGTAAAKAFDASLLALAPEHFGATPETRRYAFHSIVAMDYNNPKTAPYEPQDPIIKVLCPTGVAPGTGHQALSILTKGLRFPLCDTTSYDVVFQAIADSVIEGAQIECSFPIPEPPPNKTLDSDGVSVEYTPMGQGAPQVFVQVPNPAACVANGFYIAGNEVVLCPQACALLQTDKAAKIEVKFTCEPLIPG
jgi:hypothetical protein